MPKKNVSCPAEVTLKILGGITHRTLAQQLRQPESDGLVIRRDYGEIPPRVNYRLSSLGRSLEPVLAAMHDWAVEHPKAARIAMDK